MAEALDVRRPERNAGTGAKRRGEMKEDLGVLEPELAWELRQRGGVTPILGLGERDPNQ
ncbi:hypothetical protein [Rhodoplanes sp. Z2-YC6860]|uniref:hypothetical protein n=1 Tax=Rhodoplanes sp. Z2-YC6860 TaxID=674703 RepID=UPI0012EE1EA3|nr:hypothetical protein [Rhodoplanes sp. Z2-YC6860]